MHEIDQQNQAQIHPEAATCRRPPRRSRPYHRRRHGATISRRWPGEALTKFQPFDSSTFGEVEEELKNARGVGACWQLLLARLGGQHRQWSPAERRRKTAKLGECTKLALVSRTESGGEVNA